MKNKTKAGNSHITVKLPVMEVFLYPEVERELSLLASECDASIPDVIQALLLVFTTYQITNRGDAGE